jgi:GR25 family glycosyltransferase involved in LPS biosynthesis
MKFNETFPLIAYINLDKRKDRDLQAKTEFEKIGINPIRKSGFVPENISDRFSRGTVGCMISHVHLIQAAFLLNTNIFIFEDDILMEHGKYNVLEIMNKACEELENVDWDFFYLAGNLLAPCTQISPHLAKLTHVQSTVAYGINKKYLKTVLDNIHLDNITAPIDVIYSNMAAKNNFYISVPMVGVQRDSYSDIEGQNVNYTSYLQKRYNDNLIKM